MHVINIGRIHGIVDSEITHLRGKRMLTGPRTIDNAFITVNGDKITAIGDMDSFVEAKDDCIVDARGGIVIPAFCDSHTHIIYAGSREGEFVDKIQGLSYEEIARRGGGILNSADKLHHTSEQELLESALYRANLMMERGTGAFEVKTGYGLNTADELKMLRVAARLREAVDARVKITFLGAHAVGRAFVGRQADYVDMVIREMLPAVAAEGIAEYVDVFCDTGFFTPEETARIIDAAANYCMKAKIHANELGISGGVQVATAAGAVSADHLEQLGDEEIARLANSDT
ncbi:MAG: imidazolonepropionase, partial [Candidatus Amulumruptor sp.]|nr:imidazolonepropionase [Candidatus Amulumruptor sp.]